MLHGLAFEIEEQILDHLHDDPIALRACSLTCRAWVSPARLHLFGAVDLTCKRRCVSFLAILESAAEADGYEGTYLGEFVRELYLPVFSLRQHGRKQGLRYEMVCRICRRLPNVTTLVIDRFDWPWFIQQLCPDGDVTQIRGSLASVFLFPRLQQLRMRTFSYAIPGDVLQLITTFPNLTALELVRLVGHARSEDDPPLTVIPRVGNPAGTICLRELIVDKWSCSIPALRDLLESLFRPPFELRLRKLHWKTSDPGEDTVRNSIGVEENVLEKLLYRARKTLEEFVLNILRDGWLGQPKLVISGRWLRVVTLTCRFHTHAPSYWPNIPRFISKIEATALREVNLHFLSLWDSFHWDFFDWDDMADALIVLHEKYPLLRCTFRFSFYMSHRPMPVVVTPLKARIWRALEKGVRVVAFQEGLGANYTYNPSMPGVLDRDCGLIFSTPTQL